MEEEFVHGDTEFPSLHPDNNSKDTSSKPMFSGLNLAGMLDQLKTTVSLFEADQTKKRAIAPCNPGPQVGNKPGSQVAYGLFSGLNLHSLDMKELLKTYFPQTEPGANKKPAENNSATAKLHTPEIHLSKIRTSDVIASLIKVKKNKRVKESTLATYKKRLPLFEQRFAFLPENPEAIMDYLSRFDGESGRHRRNHQDLLNMLYTHAVRRFGLTKNPMPELERPIVTHKPVKTLSLEQVQVLNTTPEDLRERTALDLHLGHGWRPIAVRRVQAKDVASIDQQLILCHGKEREELAPILSDTAERLREMARDLDPDDFLFVAKQKRHGRRAPLGEDGMSQLIGRLLVRAGIKGFTAYDLRRTFATLVTTASNDEFLAMRLMRDKVPGQSDRYVRYPMGQLVEGLEKYSPIRQAGEVPPKDANEGQNIQKVSFIVVPVNAVVETVKESGGDGGESNSPARESSSPRSIDKVARPTIRHGSNRKTDKKRDKTLIFRDHSWEADPS